MNKKQVLAFNQAYSYEPTAAESQLVTELLTVWGKLEPAASKNPALIRKGIVFGLGLAAALEAGTVALPPVRVKKTAGTRPQEGQPEREQQ